uniref:Agroclavine dehydrogenase n=2 Tax=Clavicipitaceae TaxID=34397 RepID=G9FM44_9HYPO|nr:putative ergot alkaloid biosynthetic protein A [Clavicipitaceae sp. US2005a]AEV21222.1 agroclavine dehydrogenase [Periglandula ipomoeae]
MTILLTGGNGKTARHIAGLLEEANLPFIIGSRSNSPQTIERHRSFDWLDETTFHNILSPGEGMRPISAVWLVPSPIPDLASPVNKFIDFACSKDVKRFVLLSASIVEKGGPAMGQIHAHLDSLEGISYTVLRPTWFMENFSTMDDFQYEAIRKEGKVYSATGDGKVPFISVVDIARVALRALTGDVPDKTDHILLGPELLTYDDVAETLTRTLDRKITHARLTESELAEKMQKSGMPAEDAQMHASMDSIIQSGAEDRLNTAVRDLTGLEPRNFSDFALSEKKFWRSRD